MLHRRALPLSLPALALALSAVLPASSAHAQPGNYYGPPGPAPAGPTPAIQRRQPRPPVLSVGLGLGHHWEASERDGSEVSLIAQLNLGRSVFLAGELGGIGYDAGGSAGRIGADLGIRLGRMYNFQPYLTIGGGKLAHEDDIHARGYFEVGAGLRLPLSRRWALLGEARIGGTELVSADGLTYDDEYETVARWRGMLTVGF